MSGFRITEYQIEIPEHLRKNTHPFRAVVLSDLHNACYGEHNSALLQAIQKAAPDVVFCAGDILTAGKTLLYEHGLELLKNVAQQYPIYYANGNHESRSELQKEKYGNSYIRYEDTLKKLGITVLRNEKSFVKIKGVDLCIHGLELPQTFYKKGRFPKLTCVDIQTILGEADPNAYNILLAHHPLYAKTYAQWGADLSLSGHLHGGIVRLPFLGGIISPQFRLFPKYDRGCYRLNGRHAVVSAGLGSHTIPIRIWNPPELLVIDFH